MWVPLSELKESNPIETAEYAKAMGMHVVAADIFDDKLTLAKNLGADMVVNGTAADAIEQGLWVPQEMLCADLPQRFGYVRSPKVLQKQPESLYV